jgi:hypothetical protein
MRDTACTPPRDSAHTSLAMAVYCRSVPGIASRERRGGIAVIPGYQRRSRRQWLRAGAVAAVPASLAHCRLLRTARNVQIESGAIALRPMLADGLPAIGCAPALASPLHASARLGRPMADRSVSTGYSTTKLSAVAFRTTARGTPVSNVTSLPSCSTARARRYMSVSCRGP